MQIDTAELRVLTAALAQSYDAGQDWMAFDIGSEVVAMIDSGATDREIVWMIRHMIDARMSVGLPRSEWFDNEPW